MIQGKPNVIQHVVPTTPWKQPLDIGLMRSWKACTLEFLSETTAELVINGMGEMGLAKTAPELKLQLLSLLESVARRVATQENSRAESSTAFHAFAERAASMHTDGTLFSDKAHLAPDVELDGPENNDMWDSEDEAPAVADTEPELEEPDVTVSTWPAEASTPALRK